MALLKTRKLSPADEAQRQIDIATEIERQRAAENQRLRDLTFRNARRRETLHAAQVQQAEERRLEAFAEQQRRKRERQEREREQQAVRDQQMMATYRAARDRVEELDRQIGGLRNRDLTAQEAGELVGLRELRRGADARLLQAERSIGIYRAGRS